MYNEIDYESLRQDLMNYFGTAIASGMPQAVIDLTRVENANDEELLNIARENNININNYINNDYLRKKR